MAEIKIYDEISKWWGVSAESIVREIDAIAESDDKHIDLYINSPGGSIFEAVPIYNRLVRFSEEQGGNVVAIVDGLAASAASWIMMAADKIQMYQNTTFMIHNGIGVVWGHKEDMRESAEFLEELDDQMTDIYVARTDIKKSKIVEWMQGSRGDGTSFSAKKAHSKGFIDEVLPLKLKTKNTNKKHDFGASFERLQIRNYPKHLVDSSCDCKSCTKRREKLGNSGGPSGNDIRSQAQKRMRSLNRLRLRQRN